MPFTSETARAAGSKRNPKKGTRRPVMPERLLNKALVVLDRELDKGNINAASRVLGVLYDAGVKPTTRDDQLGEAMRELLAPLPAAPATSEEQPSQAPKTQGGPR